jgi:hypothetical protein
MAVSESDKQKLFILMAKINPTFKQRQVVLNEDEDKWIQKAVNPEHKGYCTPMTKPTCTPARKALAKRFKKGIDEEYSESTPEELKDMGEKIKMVIDKLVIDDEIGILRTLYRLLVERKKASGIPQPAVTSQVAEVNAPQNDTYFETLSAALDAVREKVAKKGFTVDEDNMFAEFGTGGINYGETKRATISLLKNGILDKRRSVTIAIYRMDSGKYELTAYLN